MENGLHISEDGSKKKTDLRSGIKTIRYIGETIHLRLRDLIIRVMLRHLKH